MYNSRWRHEIVTTRYGHSPTLIKWRAALKPQQHVIKTVMISNTDTAQNSNGIPIQLASPKATSLAGERCSNSHVRYLRRHCPLNPMPPVVLPTGAVIATNSDITFNESATFTNNNSTSDGGKNNSWQRKLLAYMVLFNGKCAQSSVYDSHWRCWCL